MGPGAARHVGVNGSRRSRPRWWPASRRAVSVGRAVVLLRSGSGGCFVSVPETLVPRVVDRRPDDGSHSIGAAPGGLDKISTLPLRQGRCSGHCCVAFPLRHSPGELARALWGYLERDDGGWFDDEGEERIGLLEIELLALMCRPLGYREAGECLPGVRHRPLREAHWVYTCRNLQPNGDCAIYDHRPRMCSEYPYGSGCEMVDCTWSPARRERQRRLEREQCEGMPYELGGEG